MFSKFYSEWNTGLWDLQIIVFCFYLHFTKRPNFFGTGLVFIILILSSAAAAYPLRDLTRCVFRYALLHTTVVMCGYLPYCHLPVSFVQSGPSPLTSLINAFLPRELLITGSFLFFAPFSANSRDCCVGKSQVISSFWDIQTTLSGTIISTVKVT